MPAHTLMCSSKHTNTSHFHLSLPVDALPWNPASQSSSLDRLCLPEAMPFFPRWLCALFQSATFLDLALTLPRALWLGQLPRLWVCGGEEGRGSGLLPSSPQWPPPPMGL